MSSLRAGDRVGNYMLQDLRGCGSFAEVWRARHHILDEEVAVKIPTEPQHLRNLRREALATHGLRHPNVVRALDIDPYATPPYLVMEYVEGPNLAELIDLHPQGLPLRSAVAILRGVLEALRAAHAQGIVHRDLKPANVLLAVRPECFEEISAPDVKVTDFGLGLCSLANEGSLEQSGSLPDPEQTLSGTIAYMAPEQRDGQLVDLRCDLFACGMLLFEMLTGRRPQGRDLPSELRPEVPRILDVIFEKCHTRLERRYASAGQILMDLAQAVAEAPGPPARTSPGTCPRCFAAPDPDDRFCIQCGEPLRDDLGRCPACRAVARPGDSFCMVCGIHLGEVATAAEG